MYSNYSNTYIPNQTNMGMNPINQMNYQPNQLPTSTQDDRFIAPFLAPFLLGGITGGLVAPLFWNRPRPYYPPYYYPPYPRYYY